MAPQAEFAWIKGTCVACNVPGMLKGALCPTAGTWSMHHFPSLWGNVFLVVVLRPQTQHCPVT